jgi:hypothetical protein
VAVASVVQGKFLSYSFFDSRPGTEGDGEGEGEDGEDSDGASISSNGSVGGREGDQGYVASPGTGGGEPGAGAGTGRRTINSDTMVALGEQARAAPWGLLPPPPDDVHFRRAVVSHDSGLQQQLRRRHTTNSAVMREVRELDAQGGGRLSFNLSPPAPAHRNRIRGLRVRRSREDLGALASEWEGGRDVDVKPPAPPPPIPIAVHAPPSPVSHTAIVLPMDYSGMKDAVDGTTYGEALLKDMDVQVKNALQAQVRRTPWRIIQQSPDEESLRAHRAVP